MTAPAARDRLGDGLGDRIASRLVDLRAELIEGRRALAALDARRDEMVAALLRVEGAVRVLEEMHGAAADT